MGISSTMVDSHERWLVQVEVVCAPLTRALRIVIYA
jgi:hypothetical protein